MDSVRRFLRSPVKVRALPYILFVLPINLGGLFELDSHFWIYVGRTVLGAGLILVMWPLVKEMRYALSWEAVVVGVAVFVMWVAIDPLYPHTSLLLEAIGTYARELGLGFSFGSGRTSPSWNPFASAGDGTALAWFFVTVRVLGSSLVVPPLEEVFFRSFLYRSIVKADFQSVSWTYFSWRAMLITAVLFGFIHDAWLSGILCAVCYQWLVIRKNRLGDAITAHAITNWLLGIWIVWNGAWSLW
jgi:uncharacterized protein